MIGSVCEFPRKPSSSSICTIDYDSGYESSHFLKHCEADDHEHELNAIERNSPSFEIHDYREEQQHQSHVSPFRMDSQPRFAKRMSEHIAYYSTHSPISPISPVTFFPDRKMEDTAPMGTVGRSTYAESISPATNLSVRPSNHTPVSPSSPHLSRPWNHDVRRSRAGRNSKLPPQALSRLQDWLDAHQDNPYPSAEVKRQLAQECGITEKQVTTWFTNARARKLNPAENWISSSEDEVHDFDEGLSVGKVEDVTYGTFGEQPPHGRGSVSGSTAYTPATRTLMNQQIPSRRGKKKNYRRTQLPKAEENTSQSLYPNSSNPGDRTRGTQETWQCTFCLRHLVPKSWRRHEETQHRPRTQWTCMLYGPRLSYSHRPGSCCAFCMTKEPSEDHFHQNHRIPECAKRPMHERTFNRPDHLRQHIKNFHGCTLFDITQSRWKRAAESSSSGWVCGFCCEDLSTWDQREKHIANHFKDGYTMDQWKHHANDDCRNHNAVRSPLIHTASMAVQMPTPAPAAYDFSRLGELSAASTSYYPSAPSTLPDMAGDPLVAMGGGFGSLAWPQVQVSHSLNTQYPMVTADYEESYLPSAPGDFESAIDNVLNFGPVLEPTHQPWSSSS